jgi:hypothetical protein
VPMSSEPFADDHFDLLADRPVELCTRKAKFHGRRLYLLLQIRPHIYILIFVNRVITLNLIHGH